MKDRKRETFIFRGLGFPIKLVNVPMRKMAGEWVLDVDFDQLQLTVLCGLLEKPALLNGDELKFIRKYLDMSTTEFGKIFGVTHVAVVKWEKGTRANPSTDVCIRLYVFDHLKKTQDKDFRNFFHRISLEKLVKSINEKVDLITIDDFKNLKSA
jgi:DNA-binding XRE family transcriptional regulator